MTSVVEVKQTFSAWLKEAAKKLVVDLFVQAFWSAWRGVTFAAGAALSAVGVVSIAASPTGSTLLPAEVHEGFVSLVQGMQILVAAASKYLAE